MFRDRWTFLALFAGVATAVLVFLFVAAQQRRVAAAAGTAESPTAGTVVIATAFIPAGTQITPDQLEERAAPVASIPPGAASHLEQLVGRRSLVPLYRGETVLQARVGRGGAPGAALVAPGRTVFALPLDAAHGVGGLITGGDVIAIIGTESSKHDDPVTLLADKVAVLGIAGDFSMTGQTAETSGRSGSAATAAGGALASAVLGRDSQRIILVDVTLEQAQLLARAVENGAVFVALQSKSPDQPDTLVDPTTGGRP